MAGLLLVLGAETVVDLLAVVEITKVADKSVVDVAVFVSGAVAVFFDGEGSNTLLVDTVVLEMALLRGIASLVGTATTDADGTIIGIKVTEGLGTASIVTETSSSEGDCGFARVAVALERTGATEEVVIVAFLLVVTHATDHALVVLCETTASPQVIGGLGGIAFVSRNSLADSCIVITMALNAVEIGVEALSTALSELSVDDLLLLTAVVNALVLQATDHSVA